MRVNLIFDHSGDCVQFQTVANHDLLAYFVSKAERDGHNSFSDNRIIHRELDKLLNECHWAVSRTNEILHDLWGQSLPQHISLTDYLDQRNLNHQHAVWVKSQDHTIDVDQLRFSSNFQQAKLGAKLHDMLPDEIRRIRLAEAMTKLGYIYPYEEVNLAVHRLEHFFTKRLEFTAAAKWEMFDNPYQDVMTSSNDVVNLTFGYTYVGRQLYDKWQHFDTLLEFDDHYNYQTLEWAFQLNLGRPQTIPFSSEFLSWCKERGVRPITTQLPIANIIDLEANLSYYRHMLYKNSCAGNRARLHIE